MRRFAAMPGLQVVFARDLTAAQTERLPDQGTLDAIAHVEQFVAPSISFQQSAGAAWPSRPSPHRLVLSPWGSSRRPHIFGAAQLSVALGVLWEGELQELSLLPSGSYVVYTARQDASHNGQCHTDQHKLQQVRLTTSDLVVTNSTTLCFSLLNQHGEVLASAEGTFIRRIASKPPLPTVALSECSLDWRLQSNIMRRVPYVNTSWGGHPLVLRGRKYSAGLGLWAPMGLTYQIDPLWCAFVGNAGIGEAFALGYFKGHMRAPYASARVLLFIDGMQVHESPMLTVQGEVWPMVVPIPQGSQMFRVVVTDGTDGHLIDYVDLVDVGFLHQGHESCNL